jgi:fucose permease
MQTGFGLALDQVGFYLFLNTIGYTLASFFNAQLSARTGFSRLLLIAAILFGVGFLGIALAPTFGWVIFFGFMTGVGGGLLDSCLNRYLAARSSSMLLNWLHASYGLGATLAPAGLSFLLSIGQSWRVGFQVMAIFQALLVGVLLLSMNRWESSQAGTPTAEMIAPARPVSLWETMRVPAVWLAMALFFIYTGAEFTAGQWAYSLFTLGRGVSETTAGWWTSLYWASFTVGRIFLGVLIDRYGFKWSMRVLFIGASLGTLLLWWNPVEGVSYAGLALIGLSFAPVFPTLIAVTPRLLGKRQAVNAIGMQMAFGGIGIAAMPWLAGFLAERISLEVISPYLLAECALMFILFEILLRKRVRDGTVG